MARALLLAALLVQAACTSTSSTCNTSTEREVDGACLLLCNSSRDCRNGEQCRDGACMPGTAGSSSGGVVSSAGGGSSAAGSGMSSRASGGSAATSVAASTSGGGTSSGAGASTAHSTAGSSTASAGASSAASQATASSLSAGASSMAPATSTAGAASSAWDGCVVGGNPVPSGQGDPQNPCRVCDPSRDASAYSPRDEGTDCGQDPNPCNGRYECRSGDCVGVVGPMTCDNPGPCETAVGATCDSRSGNCVYPAVDNGTPCSDGLACTSRDTCQDGQCMAGMANPCDRLPICKTAAGAFCSEPNGCEFPTNEPDGTSCGSGMVCVGGACMNGCFIGGVAYAPGDEVGSICRQCDPTSSTTAFTPANEGAMCNTSGNLRECCTGSCVRPVDCLR